MIRKLLLAIAALLLLTYLWLAFAGIDPQDRRPGTRLSGVEAPIPTDWVFLAAAEEVQIETRPWYGVPFSVTTVIANEGNRIFVPSLYEAALPFPGSKYWNKVVAADPHVRLRVDGTLYEMNIAPVLDPQDFQTALKALANKYPFWQQKLETDGPDRHYALLRLSPR